MARSFARSFEPSSQKLYTWRPLKSQMPQPSLSSWDPMTTCLPSGAHAAVVQGYVKSLIHSMQAPVLTSHILAEFSGCEQHVMILESSGLHARCVTPESCWSSR